MRYFLETNNKRGTIGWVYIHDNHHFEDENEIEVLAELVSMVSERVLKNDLHEISKEDYLTILDEEDKGITRRSEEIINSL